MARVSVSLVPRTSPEPKARRPDKIELAPHRNQPVLFRGASIRHAVDFSSSPPAPDPDEDSIFGWPGRRFKASGEHWPPRALTPGDPAAGIPRCGRYRWHRFSAPSPSLTCPRLPPLLIDWLFRSLLSGDWKMAACSTVTSSRASARGGMRRAAPGAPRVRRGCLTGSDRATTASSAGSDGDVGGAVSLLLL